jgi:MFS family permease
VRRANLLVLAATIAMLGWGTVLPYQYAYAANSRGWGSMVGAAAASLFSVGALIAAPLGGRLSDRVHPAAVAVVARTIAAVAALTLIIADRPATFLAGMALFGFGLVAGSPAQSVLALRWSSGADRRKTFAWLASGQALGMGIGSFIAGFLVDLDRPDGMLPSFLIASAGFVISAVLIGIAARGVNDLTSTPMTVGELDGGSKQAWKLILGSKPLLLITVIAIAVSLTYNAQFESGLPAYGLTVLQIEEHTVGIAAAVNCAVILGLQMLVVRWTVNRSPAGMLMVVGAIWVLCWSLLGLAAGLPGWSSMIFVGTFALFAFGETLFAPVLNPLVAGLTPNAMVGRTLGLFTACQTGATAIGPLLSGATLGAGLSSVFIIGNVVISLVAIVAGRRLATVLRQPSVSSAPAPSTAG